MGDKFITDDFRGEASKKQITGVAICGSPLEMKMLFDYTCLRGGASNMYLAFISRVGKWDYAVKKADEWTEVTPLWAEFYNLTTSQKQKLMGEIKSGLTSAAQSVADYELMAHDARRYREILDYFKAATKDQSVLRSLFVDRVDAYTGEGYSLITMARRWPTIITDFVRMKEEWTDVNKIHEELDVAIAEASVLKVKNELFKEWKKLFFPTVKERYARILNLMESRKKSVDEYRNWLKPYIAKFKMMKEKTEIKPSEFLTNPFMTPGFAGQTQALSDIRIWMWKPFTPADIRKPSAVKTATRAGIKFIVDPYDNLVREWKKKIEENYGIEITDKEVDGIIAKAVNTPDRPELVPDRPYYIFFDIDYFIGFYHAPPPEGADTDNPMINIRSYFMSQNVVLLHLIELYAREKVFDKYINEIIGAKELEEEKLKEIEKEFAEPKPERLAGIKKFVAATNAAGKKIRGPLERFFYIFVQRGPYETIFYERVSKMFARAMGEDYKAILDMFRSFMKVE